MTRNFKLITDEKLAGYGTPLRFVQEKYNEAVKYYQQHSLDYERAQLNMNSYADSADKWLAAGRLLRGLGK